MSLFESATLLASSAEQTTELPLHPYAIGAIGFALLLGLLLGVLSVGKGRNYRQ